MSGGSRKEDSYGRLGYKDKSTDGGGDSTTTEHTMHRAGAGMAQRMCDRCGHTSLQRKMRCDLQQSPTTEDDVFLIRMSRVFGRPSSRIQDLKWRAKPEISKLVCYVDGDWSGEVDTRKNVSRVQILVIVTGLNRYLIGISGDTSAYV